MKTCNKEDCNNPRFGGGYCSWHQSLRTDKKPKGLSSKTPIKVKPRKATGELEMFKMIWSERPHVCECCSSSLSSFSPICFSHILAKGSYPKFRLLKENVKLVCPTCHNDWEFSGREHPKFDWVKDKYERLRYKYYNP